MRKNNSKYNIANGHRILLGSILCLFALCVIAAQKGPKKRPARKTDSRVFLLHADILHYDQFTNPNAQILNGNVAFRHLGTLMYCDSAYYYEADNSFEAFGHVRMKQGDTLSLTGNYLFYDGNDQIAQLRDNCVMKHRKSVLTTDSLDYDRLYDVGYFYGGGRLTDKDNVLTSEWGEYSPTTHEAIFNYNVKLNNPKFKIVSDTLGYNTKTEFANILGPTDIYSGDTKIESTNGLYDTRKDQAFLNSRSTIINNDRTITGDTLFYDKIQGIGQGFSNVEMIDYKNKMILNADICYYDDNLGYSHATKRALIRDYSQPDTLYLHGDSLKLYTFNINTDSVYRKAHAFKHVRFFRKDAQGVADSLVFNSLDSCLTLYQNPIIWNGRQQLLGEEINVYMNDSTIRYANVLGQALSAEQIDSIRFNQVAGKEMRAYFENGKIEHTEVIQNVLIAYYPLESDSTIIAFNRSEATQLNMYLKDSKIKRIVLYKQPKGKYYPLNKIPQSELYLPNFAWFDYIRPLNKDDIFEWRGKKAGTELRQETHSSAPVQSLDKIKNEK